MLGVFEGLVLVEELESTLIIHRVFSQEEGSSGDPSIALGEEKTSF